jgi:hypothetical protein
MDLLARTSGTWINVAAVLLGTTVGLVAGGRLPDRIGRTLMQVLGLVDAFLEQHLRAAHLHPADGNCADFRHEYGVSFIRWSLRVRVLARRVTGYPRRA